MSIDAKVGYIINFFRKIFSHLYKIFLRPRLLNEDDRRKERILTLILLSVNLFLIYLWISAARSKIQWQNEYTGINIYLFTFFVLIFVSLYYLCRIGYYKVSSYIFIITFLALTIYGSIVFGVSMPAGLLSYVFIIIVASLVINTRIGLLISVTSVLSIISVGILEHSRNEIHNWRFVSVQINDLIQYSVFFIILAIVSWISNSEIERSLSRARKSEKLLKEERDNLEVLVEKRTAELYSAERERISQLARFAEFGKRSAGLFHDLLSPLSALSLTITGLRKNDTEEAERSISNAIDATRKMQQFMNTIRQQLSHESSNTEFRVIQSIEESVRLLSYQARKVDVDILVTCPADIMLHGSSFKFTQIVTNLLANSIESHIGKTSANRSVSVNVSVTKSNLELYVSDNGVGISPDVLPHIFTTFYTTKTSGIGLGLSTVKDTVEKSFLGTITCESKLGVGTKFKISIPIS